MADQPDDETTVSAKPIVGTSKGYGERIIEKVLAGCGSVSVLITVGIVGTLLLETYHFFSEVGFGAFFGDTQWTPLFANKHFGIWPLVCGTMITAAIAMFVAVPMGLLAAIYLSEFASPRARSILKPALELLAGVPTIVYGYFALIVVTPALQQVFPELQGFNALSPGIVMGIMIIPMVSSLSEDALYAVPRSLREAAWGMGAGRAATIRRVILPAALSGIVASVLLALARAVGETMIVAIAAGQQANFSIDPTESVQTMTAFIVQVSMGDTPAGTTEYRTIFAVASTLFVFTFVINGISQHIVHKQRKKQGH
jgi:phosphate transport system permease protein